MTYYTIVPPDELLSDDESAHTVMMIRRGQVTMEVELVSGSLGSIRRIYSSDPEVYLDVGLQPGTIIPIGLADYLPK
ncbi:MAG TPA: hypothetical protein GXZ82_08770 [Firmicutes bacterium]|jgi:hypothetical protein|nr:hypothetical protein [Bacillota bacterium]